MGKGKILVIIIGLLAGWAIIGAMNHNEPTSAETDKRITAIEKSAPTESVKTTATASPKSSAPNISVPSRPTSEASSSDTQAKSRVKAYMDSLPGSMIVIVRGDSAGIIVEADYNFGTGDKETAKSLAKDLIYQIMGDNSDCTFKYISVNCMNGKKPVGAIVNYENGSFTTIP